VEAGKMKEKNKKVRVEILARDVQVTSKGVELTGKDAKVFARFLSNRHRAAIGALQHLDSDLKPGDIQIDPDGRVIVRSGRIQKLAFESIRFGVNPANPKSLGRLIRKTGGQFGPLIQRRVDPDDWSSSVKGEQGHHVTNVMCKGDNGLNVICSEWDEDLPDTDPNDFNCFCGWGS
jgi:hypothetical protein